MFSPAVPMIQTCQKIDKIMYPTQHITTEKVLILNIMNEIKPFLHVVMQCYELLCVMPSMSSQQSIKQIAMNFPLNSMHYVQANGALSRN